MIIVEIAAKLVSVSLNVNVFCTVFRDNKMEFHFLIFDLKSLSDTDYLISCGTKLQMFGPKWDRDSVPL